MHVDEQLERVRLLLGALEVERAGHGLEPRHRDVEVGVGDLADVEVGELDLQLRAAQVRIGQLDEDVRRLDVAVAGVAHEVRELDRGRDRHDVLEHAEDALAQRHREQVVAAALLARALEALLERHVEQLEDHEVVLDLVADRRRDEPGAVAFARAEQLDDVRVTLDALEDLLLHLEAHLVLAATRPLQALDRDRAAQRGLRLDPALLAEVRLREAAGAELDRLAGLVDDERVDRGCARRTASAARSRPRPASSAGRASADAACVIVPGVACTPALPYGSAAAGRRRARAAASRCANCWRRRRLRLRRRRLRRCGGVAGGCGIWLMLVGSPSKSP